MPKPTLVVVSGPPGCAGPAGGGARDRGEIALPGDLQGRDQRRHGARVRRRFRTGGGRSADAAYAGGLLRGPTPDDHSGGDSRGRGRFPGPSCGDRGSNRSPTSHACGSSSATSIRRSLEKGARPRPRRAAGAFTPESSARRSRTGKKHSHRSTVFRFPRRRSTSTRHTDMRRNSKKIVRFINS